MAYVESPYIAGVVVSCSSPSTIAVTTVSSATSAPSSCTEPRKRQGSCELPPVNVEVGEGDGEGEGETVGSGLSVGAAVGAAVGDAVGLGVDVGASSSPQPMTVIAIISISRGANMAASFFIDSPFIFKIRLYYKTTKLLASFYKRLRYICQSYFKEKVLPNGLSAGIIMADRTFNSVRRGW